MLELQWHKNDHRKVDGRSDTGPRIVAIQHGLECLNGLHGVRVKKKIDKENYSHFELLGPQL